MFYCSQSRTCFSCACDDLIADKTSNQKQNILAILFFFPELKKIERRNRENTQYRMNKHHDSLNHNHEYKSLSYIYKLVTTVNVQIADYGFE